MRCAFIFASCACTFPLSGQTLPSYVPSEGLVGWWPFNGNANDESGNGNHGSINGALLANDRNGVIQSAFDFHPSVGSHIVVPFSSSIQSVQQGVSISTWIYMDGGTGTWAPPRVLELRGGYGGGGNAGFVIRTYGNSNNSRSFELRWYTDNGSTNVSIPMTSNSLTALTWHQLVFTGDGNSGIAKCYFDGLLVEEITQDFISNCNYNGNSLFIGAEPNLAGMWGGKLDDIGIWNRALTAEEVMALYLGNQLVPGCTDPAACNFSAEANSDDGSCIEAGCTDPAACNFNPEAGCDDGSCAPAEAVPGCMEAAACNYDAAAVCAGPCVYPPAGSADCGAGAAFCGEGMVWDAAQQTCLIDPAYVAGIAAGAAQGACGPWTVWDAGAGQCVGAATPACASDLSGNGSIGIEDLLILLSEFAMMCP